MFKCIEENALLLANQNLSNTLENNFPVAVTSMHPSVKLISTHFSIKDVELK